MLVHGFRESQDYARVWYDTHVTAGRLIILFAERPRRPSIPRDHDPPLSDFGQQQKLYTRNPPPVYAKHALRPKYTAGNV